MRRLLPLLAYAFVSPGPSQAQHVYRYTLSERQLAIIKEEVGTSFKAPADVGFDSISAAQQSRGKVLVCGCINLKSTLPGCSGMTPFHGILTGDEFRLTIVRDLEERRMTCTLNGIPFREPPSVK